MKRGLDLNAFQTVVEMLASTGTLLPKYKPHRLKGKYNGLWECHIAPDWLLVGSNMMKSYYWFLLIRERIAISLSNLALKQELIMPSA
jgi:mRNA-degrading endonuclease YafQ of YafQ-DinJ toxin-antitoxin module